MTILSIPDITLQGFATPVPLSATPLPCKWFQVQGITIAGASARLGDASIGAAAGAPLGATAGQFFPQGGTPYDLGGQYVAGTLNDVVAVIYAV